MRRIISGLFISLEGVIEAQDQWHFPYFNDEMGEAVGSTVANADAVLFRRKTFINFQSYWPSQGRRCRSPASSTTSRSTSSPPTLTETTWANSSIISGDVAAQIRDLKASEGNDISITGSGTLVMWLLRQGLLDNCASWSTRSSSARKRSTLWDGGSDWAWNCSTWKVFKNGVTHQIYAKADIPESTITF